MDVYSVRNQLKTKSIYDIPLRVTFYARVSSDKDAQLNSLENQMKYYTSLICKNKNWTYIKGYIDEGISGITTKNRESFHTMIEDAKQGKFDFIITKEITRFARNTLDSIQYTRELLNCGVCVLFQNDNINTLDEDSELRLTIMSGIAQDEVRKLSSRVKFGHQQAIRNGVVLGNGRIFGYIKKDKKLIIDEDESKMVRELFELYSTDQYSMKQIEDIFWDKGYRNHNGNKISHTTMSGIISNPKYKGYYVGNKVRIIDIFSKKQKFLPPEEWVMYKDETGEIVPAIVSEEIWDRANSILLRRSNDVKRRQNKSNHANLLTGKLMCTHCGTVYYRKDAVYKGSKMSRWVCSGKLKNGKDSCPSFAINEKEIKQILFEVFVETYEDAEKYLDEYLEIYRSALHLQSENNIEQYDKIIANEERKKEKLLQYNVDGKISDEDFLKMYNKCKEEILRARDIIQTFVSQNESLKAVSKELQSIRSQLKQAIQNINENADITISFVNRYIDKIFVTPLDDGSMQLDIKLFTSDDVKKIIVRSGHMRKKICPVRTKSFIRNSRTLPKHELLVTYKYCICI